MKMCLVLHMILYDSHYIHSLKYMSRFEFNGGITFSYFYRSSVFYFCYLTLLLFKLRMKVAFIWHFLLKVSPESDFNRLKIPNIVYQLKLPDTKTNETESKLKTTLKGKSLIHYVSSLQTLKQGPINRYLYISKTSVTAKL